MNKKLLMIGAAVFLIFVGYFAGTLSITFGGESDEEEIHLLIKRGYVKTANEVRQRMLRHDPKKAMQFLSKDGRGLGEMRAATLEEHVLHPEIPSTLEIARKIREMRKEGMSHQNIDRKLRSMYR